MTVSTTATARTWTPSFYSYDGMGSVRQLTNTAAAVTDTYEYDAFGNQISHTGTTPNNYLYRGEQFDPDLGLYYLRARYYNPLSGRFMSRDPNNPQPADANGTPINPKELHKYLYAGGDPIDAQDPEGRAIIDYALGTSATYNAVAVGTSPAVWGYALGVASAYCKFAGILQWLGSHHWLGINPFDLPEPFGGYCAIKG